MSQAFIGSLALMRRFVAERCLWLFRKEGDLLRLLQAARLEGESYREVIDREVGWTLRLQRGTDYIVSSAPRAHFQGVLEDPNRGGIFYVVEFYIVDLFGTAAVPVLESDPANVWLSTAELLSGGVPEARIDPTQMQLLQLTEAIRPEAI